MNLSDCCCVGGEKSLFIHRRPQSTHDRPKHLVCHSARPRYLHGASSTNPRTPPEVVDDVYPGGSCLGCSFPGPAVCPSCRVYPIGRLFWDFLPVGQALIPPIACFFRRVLLPWTPRPGFPRDPSATLTLGVEILPGLFVYLIAGGNHLASRQFRLQGNLLKHDCVNRGMSSASLSFGSRWHSGERLCTSFEVRVHEE